MTDWTLIDNLITSQFENAQEGVNPITSAELADFAKKVVAVAKVSEVVDAAQTAKDTEHDAASTAQSRMMYLMFAQREESAGRGLFADPAFSNGFSFPMESAPTVAITKQTEAPSGYPNAYLIGNLNANPNAYFGFHYPFAANRKVLSAIFAKMPIGAYLGNVSEGVFVGENTGTGEWKWYFSVQSWEAVDNGADGGHFTISGCDAVEIAFTGFYLLPQGL